MIWLTHKERGFTLIELVIVFVLLTIVAVFIAPRLLTNEFEELGFSVASLAIVRYAHKLSMATGCSVQVAVTPGAGCTIALNYTGTGGCAGTVPNPSGAGAFSITAPASVSLAGATFTYDLRGDPGAGVVITIIGTQTRTLTITNNTGFVVAS